MKYGNQFNVTAFGCFVGVVLCLSACGHSEKQESAEKTSAAPAGQLELSDQALRLAALETAVVKQSDVAGQVVTTGEIKTSDNLVFHVNSFVSGRVLKDHVVLGQTVSQGQTLAVIQNLDVAKIQAQYIHELHQNEIDIEKARARYSFAQKTLERERRLLAEGISPRRDYQQAEADADIARTELEGQKEHKIHIRAEGKAMLSAYGMAPVNVHSERIQNGSPIIAPRSGVVTKKTITLGDMVTPEMVMYEISDLSQVWLDMAVYPKDVANVSLGQKVSFSTDSLPGAKFTGRVDYVQPVASDASQTYIARAYLANAKGVLKPGMFGQVRIEQLNAVAKPFVPEAAVQTYGRESFVFIPLARNHFRKQTVVVAGKTTGGYLLGQGLSVGDIVVTKGSFMLKAELLKSQFAEED